MRDTRFITSKPIIFRGMRGKQAASLTYNLITDLEEMDDGLIRSLAPEHYRIIGKEFSRVVEKSLNGAQVRYVVVRSEDRPVALIYLVENQATLSIPKFGDAKSGLKIKYVVCGNPIITGDCGICAPDKTLRDKLLPQLLNVLKQALKKLGISAVILRDVEAPKPIFTRAGFFPIPSEPALGISGVNRWKNFSDYLKDMEGKHRKKVTTARRKLEEKGVTIHLEKDISSINDRLYELYINVARREQRSSGKPSLQNIPTIITNLPRRFRKRELSKDYFNVFQEHLGDQFDVVSLRMGDKIIAYTINIHDGDTYHSIFSGMEYSEDTPLIYRTLLSTKIERAIERGVSEIDFGRTGLLTKLELGAHTRPLHCYALISRPFLAPVNAMIRFFAEKVPPAEVPYRNVFKSEGDGMKEWYDTNWRDFYGDPKTVKSYESSFSVLKLVKGGRAFRGRCLSMLSLTHGNKVVDLCCGTGNLAIALADAVGEGGEVHGIDLSSQMIGKAETKNGGRNLLFKVMDASRTEFPDKYFDAAAIIAALHEMPLQKRLAVLLEANRILKPGGKLLVGEHYIAESRLGKRVQAVVFKMISEKQERATFKDMIQDGLSKEIREAGFRVIGHQVMPGRLFHVVAAIKPPETTSPAE